MSHTDQENPAETLQAPLQRLEQTGLPRPPSLTLEQYLERLMAADALSPRAVRRFLEVYQDVRYGSKEVPLERVVVASDALLMEAEGLAEMDPAALATIRGRLSPSPAPAPAITGRPTAPLIPLSPPPSPPGAGGPVAARPSLPGRPADAPTRPPLRQRLPSLRSLALVATAVMVWSVAMLGVGYWQSPRIKALVKRFKAPEKQPAPRQKMTPRLVLQRLRKAAAARPEDLPRWRQYAAYASEIGQYADAIIGYHHVIYMDPKDHMSLNNLAWLYCTARDPVARDKVRALALAERAYSIHKAPYVVDTLAEACFQNGHIKRAIALEEDALRRATERKEFFRKQLEKFKRGSRKRAEASGQPGKKKR